MDLQKWRKKKERASKDGNLDQLFYACKELAESYFRDEKYDEALREYKEMAHISEASGNQMDVARANRMIGEVYSEKGEFSEAIKHQRIHLDKSRDHNDRVEEQRALATLGRTYFLQAESFVESISKERNEALQNAKNYYKQSLSICESLSEDKVGSKQKMEMRARLFLNLGLVLDSQNLVEEATERMSMAVMICKKLDLWEDLFRTYTALGSHYQRQGNHSEALKTFDLALDVAPRLDNKVQLMCEVLPLKAEVLLGLPNFRGSRQALLRAFKLKSPSSLFRKEIEKKLRIVAEMCKCEEKLMDLIPNEEMEARKKIYEQIGDMASELKNFPLALTYYHLMLECVQKMGQKGKPLIDSYVSLAQTYADDKQYSQALEYFKKELVLEISTPSEACKTTLNIAEILQQMGKADDMIKAYDEAKRLVDISTDKKLKCTVLKCMVRSLTELNRQSLAEKVQTELDCQAWDLPESNSDSEEEESKEFGVDIELDDLTDEEENGEGCQTEQKQTRRPRNKTHIQKRNEKGETPLHTAAINGNLMLVQKLLDQGHSIDVRDYSGWTPLHEACNHGHLSVVEALLAKGANINDRGGPLCEGFTPLLDAASNGRLQVIHLLLDKGASCLMRTNKGESILDCLILWRDRFVAEEGVDLSGETLNQYNFLCRKFKRTLENAGQKPSAIEAEMLKSKHSAPLAPCLANDMRRKSDDSEPVRTTERCHSGDAAAEYENAMKALRNRSKQEKQVNVAIHKPEVPALLADDDNVGDDWLEEDVILGRPKKRRRLEPFPEDNLNRRSYPQMISDDSNDSNDRVENMNYSPERHYDDFMVKPSTSGSFSNRLKVMNSGRRKQMSLMATGVSREKIKKNSSKRIEEIEDDNSDKETVISQKEELNVQKLKSPPASTLKPMACVRVRIEDKLLLVPIPSNSEEELTVGWLAKETAKRYYSLEGVEPKLRLLMEDGALLSESDPVSLVLHCTEVVGSVHSWNLEPLSIRYENACREANTRVDRHLKEVLEICQATGSVSLEELYLTQKCLLPVLKALSHHHSLQILKLSGNNIGDQGVKILAECTAKLPNLQILDISNINITEDGLNHLSQSVSKSKALQRLRKLKLGYNPLGNCLKSLDPLLNTIPSLASLSLPSIGLTCSAFRSPLSFSLESIEHLNVNDNSELGVEGVRVLLGLLSPGIISSLKLSGAGQFVPREVGIYLQENQPPSLTSLDVSYCSPNSDDMQALIRGIEMTPNLESLQLDGPCTVSECVLLTLLRLPLRKLSMAGTEVNVEVELPERLSLLAISSCIDQPWACPAPYALAFTAPPSKAFDCY